MSAAIDATDVLFDAEFLRKLERLELLANKIFRGLIRGCGLARNARVDCLLRAPQLAPDW